MNKKKLLPLALLVIMAVAALLIKQCNTSTPEVKPVVNITNDSANDNRKKQNSDKSKQDPAADNRKPGNTGGFRPHGLIRNPALINYSKHARCRMDCRHISEQEVKQILLEGKINYAKSDLKEKDECKKKYAVEGYTKDNQHVRMIFAPCSDEVTVVTVIDLGKEWVCDCE